MIGVLADGLAAVAVAAVVSGWALGQWPTIVPGLDVREAAAPHDTLVAVVVAVLGGGAIVFLSLALLFRLTLAGQLDAGAPRATEPQPEGRRRAHDRSALLARTAVACLRRRVSARNSASCLTPTQRGAEEETLLLWRLA